MNPVSQIDLVPTLLDLLGQPLPGHLQGKSIRAQLESDHPRVNDSIFIEWSGPNNGLGDVLGGVQFPEWMTELADPETIRATVTDPVRTVITPDGWKFNCSPLGEHELYDLNADPYEKQNLFGEHQTRKVVQNLLKQIRAWQERMKDKVTLPNL